MDTRLLLITGTDYPVPECQIVLHQPSIEEIGFIGEDSFFMAVQTFVVNTDMLEMDKSDLKNTNNFQIFMMIMNSPETKDKKQCILDLLKILLKGQQVIFTPQTFLIKSADQTIIIDDKNFNYFQDAIKNIFCLNKSFNNGETQYNPSDKRAKEIVDKIMKGRKKIAQEKGKTTGSIYTQYLSILSVALHLSLNELKHYTVFQLYDSIERFSLWTDFDLDIKTRLAGGNPKQSPENWMKNIY